MKTFGLLIILFISYTSVCQDLTSRKVIPMEPSDELGEAKRYYGDYYIIVDDSFNEIAINDTDSLILRHVNIAEVLIRRESNTEGYINIPHHQLFMKVLKNEETETLENE